MAKHRKEKELTFQGVLKSLEKRDDGFSEVAKALESVMVPVMLILAGPLKGTAIMAALQTAKEGKLIELLKQLRDMYVSDAGKKLTLSKRMDGAYATICYTAFFETLSQRLPPDIRKGLDLQEKEKLQAYNNNNDGSLPSDNIKLAKPNVAYCLDEAMEDLSGVYTTMTERLLNLIQGLRFVETANEETLASIRTAFEGLPEAALESFEAQYFELCLKIPEFFSYVNIQSHREYAKKAEELLSKLDHSVSESEAKLIGLILNSSSEIKAGFTELKGCFRDLFRQIEHENALDAANLMITKARAKIEAPVFGSEKNADGLTIPSIEEAFIPQSFKALIYTGEERLERKQVWEDCRTEDDQAAFWARFFNDPASVEHLLLILGEPGIGKSLLTTMVAARMGSTEQLIVRVPLREADPERGISGMILDQINRDGDVAEPFKTLKGFLRNFPGQPLTVFFDGYDELQQATGRVYHEFLNKLSAFQRECQENQRPVRIIVTSRVTLIDKAIIPHGTVVMQLNEFEPERKQKWIGVWNEANQRSFELGGIGKFELPENSPETDELSGQPLLLLMLAMYDADFEGQTNALRSNTNITRTELYNELIRRFIRRELEKGGRSGETDYTTLAGKKKKAAEEEEMKRLGAAALGMFMRGKLSLTVEELGKDLSLLNAATRNIPRSDKEMLKNEEAIFGSFFFIHDPRPSDASEERFRQASYEFLHKTFYEFLAADIVLRTVSRPVKTLFEKKLREAEEDEDYYGIETTYGEALENVLLDPKDCFLVLSGGILCSEPVIVQMMAEWSEERFWSILPQDCDRGKVEEVFQDLFSSSVKLVRKGSLPKAKTSACCIAEGRTKPQVCASYLLNLLTVAVVCCGKAELSPELWRYAAGFIHLNLPETVKQKEDGEGSKPRFKLEPADELILRFTGFVEPQIVENKAAYFKLRKKAVELEQLDLLEARMEIFGFLCAAEQRDLYALHRTDFPSRKKLDKLRSLGGRGMDIDAERRIAELCDAWQEGRDSFDLDHVLHSLVYCEDESLIQKALSVILTYLDTVSLPRVDVHTLVQFKRLIKTKRLSAGTIKAVLLIFDRLFKSRSTTEFGRNVVPEILEDTLCAWLWRYKAPTGRFEMFEQFAKRMSHTRDSDYSVDYSGLVSRYFGQMGILPPHVLKWELLFSEGEYLLSKYAADIDYPALFQRNFDTYLDAVMLMNYAGTRNGSLRNWDVSDLPAGKTLKLYRAARDTDESLKAEIEMLFAERFPSFYFAEPEASVYMLCEMANMSWETKTQHSIRIKDMCMFALKEYPRILDKSLSAAILLLTLCLRQRLNPDLLRRAVIACFNTFIYDPGYEYVDRMLDLVWVLGKADQRLKENLVGYFRKNLKKIHGANPVVAEMLKKVYPNLV